MHRHCRAGRVSGWCLALLLLAVGQVGLSAQGAPARVVLLVDSSSSMQQMLNQYRAGLKVFLEGLPAETELTLISTGGQLRVRVPPTTDRERLGKAMDSFASDSGGNSVIMAMIESDKRFLESAKVERPVIVVLTNDSDAVADAAVERYNEWMPGFIRRGGRAYGVVIRSRNMGLPSQIVENIAKNSGGHSETIATATGIADQMKKIAGQLAGAK